MRGTPPEPGRCGATTPTPFLPAAVFYSLAGLKKQQQKSV
jgi:hypothetical protein